MKRFLFISLVIFLSLLQIAPTRALEKASQPIIKQASLGLAVDSNGTLWGWGVNGKGELGYFGGDGWDLIGPHQMHPRQVLFSDGIPAPLESDISVVPEIAHVLIDGKPVSLPVLMNYDDQGGGTTYVRLRDLAYSFNDTRSNFNVSYNNATGITSLFIGGYTPIGGEMVPPDLNAQVAKLSRGAFGSSSTDAAEYYHTLTVTDNKGDSCTYIRLRDLAPSHYFNVIWDGRQIIMETGTWYTWSEVSFLPLNNKTIN